MFHVLLLKMLAFKKKKTKMQVVVNNDERYWDACTS